MPLIVEAGFDALNPMELKKRLSREIINQLYDKKTTAKAEEHFSRVIQKKEVPEKIKEYRVNLNASIDIRGILTATHLAKSRSEANRLIAQGAVEIDGEKVTNNIASIKSGSIIKAGKRRWVRLVESD